MLVLMSLRVLTYCVWCAGVFGPGSSPAWYTTIQPGIQWWWWSISISLVAGTQMRGLVLRFLSHQILEARKCYIYASCWDKWEHPFGCSLWASYTHLLVEWVFVHTEDESFSPWLKETSSSVCHWSVHLTSHIGDMRHILSGLDCAYIARKSASGNIYAYIFLKSTKCYKLWTLVFFNSYLCLTVTIWVL